jgi:predicted acylesterase/phospholipase RssA
MKSDLALGGGGSFGAFHLGVLLQLTKNGTIPVSDLFSRIVGTSTGNLCGVGLAFKGVLGLKSIWTEITGTQDIYVSKDPSGIPINEIFDLAFGSWDGLLNDSPLWKLIQSIVTGIPTVPVTSCFVDYVDGQTYFVTALTDGTFVLEHGDGTVETYDQSWLSQYQLCVLASASTPGGVNSVTIKLKTKTLTGAFDGGVEDMIPNDYTLGLANGSGQVISISLTDPISVYTGETNVVGTLNRSIELLTYGQFIQSRERLRSALSSTLNIVEYQKPALGGDSTQFVPSIIESYVNAGLSASPIFGKLLD